MRINPNEKYYKKCCSYIGVGCAYEDIYHKEFNGTIPKILNNDGYILLSELDKFVYDNLDVELKHYFKGNERLTLEQFLNQNDRKCCVYVYGHFMYVNGKNYWSYYINDKVEVVCVWYLKD